MELKRSHHKKKTAESVGPVGRARDKVLGELVAAVSAEEAITQAVIEDQRAKRAKSRALALKHLDKANAAYKEAVSSGAIPSLPELARRAKETRRKAGGESGLWASTRKVVEFTQKLLGDKEYQAALRKRIIAGEAPSIEVLLYQYAYGKPVERVQVEQKTAVTIIDRLSGGDVVVVGKGAGSASHRARVGAIAESAVDDAGGGGALRDGGAGGQDDGGVPSGVAGFAGVSGDGVVPEPGDG
jgi:hypothetical protein